MSSFFVFRTNGKNEYLDESNICNCYGNFLKVSLLKLATWSQLCSKLFPNNNNSGIWEKSLMENFIFFVQCSSWWVLILPRRYNADSHWCLRRFCRDQRNPWWLFSQNMGLNFLVMIDLSSFVYTNFFWWSGNCNWNRLDEDFSVR